MPVRPVTLGNVKTGSSVGIVAVGSKVKRVGDRTDVKRKFEHGRTAMFSKNRPVGDRYMSLVEGVAVAQAKRGAKSKTVLNML
jgi:hypothetical protein